MTIRQEYGKLLSKYNRTIGKAKKLGLDLDYGYTPVKNPTRASIRRLARIVAKAEGQVWATRELSKSKNPLVKDIISEVPQEEDTDIPDMADIIINNFRTEIDKLFKENYVILPSNKKPYRGNSDSYNIYLEEQNSKLEDFLENALKKDGKQKIASRIQNKGLLLAAAMDNLVYNLYSYLQHMGKDYTEETHFEELIQGYLEQD